MKKYTIAKNFSKSLIKLLKVVRPDAGTSLPGAIMMKLCPEFIKTESKKITKKTICITGTNGKTTTSGLIASILNELEASIVYNKKGANMPQGIATSFLQNNNENIDYGVFECDEAWLYSLFKSMTADYLLITNLFPDQTERYGGVYSLGKRIKKAIELNPKLSVVINADDPHLLPLIDDNTILFSVEKIKNSIDELKYKTEICTCGEEYRYKKRFYAHLGDYFCKKCKNKHPNAKYKAKVVLSEDKTEIEINGEYAFSTSLLGSYNAYNILSAAVIAIEMGISSEIIQKGFDNYQNEFGRMDKFDVNGKNVIVQLIKNPAGTNQSIKLIKDNFNSKLFIAINDTPADGSDISWLYDTDFEYFKDYPNEIIFSGTKANEIALRFKHAGLSEEQFYVEQNIKKAYKHSINETKSGENLLIMANFTAISQLKKIMKK